MRVDQTRPAAVVPWEGGGLGRGGCVVVGGGRVHKSQFVCMFLLWTNALGLGLKQLLRILTTLKSGVCGSDGSVKAFTLSASEFH